MWISTRAQYGMRALVEIAKGGERPTSLKVVSVRQGLSQQYLEQIFSVLRKAGFVESVRGARGGYRMKRSPLEVQALEVVELLEGTLARVICIEDKEACDRVGQCSTEDLWHQVDAAVRSVLSETKISDLLDDGSLLQLGPLPEQFARVT